MNRPVEIRPEEIAPRRRAILSPWCFGLTVADSPCLSSARAGENGRSALCSSSGGSAGELSVCAAGPVIVGLHDSAVSPSFEEVKEAFREDNERDTTPRFSMTAIF